MVVVGMMNTVPAFADGLSNQGGGVMNFVGSVINAPCSIKPESQNIQVKLSDWTTTKLNTGGNHSDPVPVTIELSECSFGTKTPQTGEVPLSKVAITFPDGITLPPADAKLGHLKNTAVNPAGNVVIQLLKSDGTSGVDLTKSSATAQDIDNIKLNTDSQTNKLQFFAQILATGPASVGDVAARLTYKLNYF